MKNLLLLLLLFSCVFSMAQEAEVATSEVPKEESAISVLVRGDVVSQYWYNGIVCENQGLIFQPAVYLNINLFQGNFLTSLDFNIGTFATFLDSPVSDVANGSTDHHYEQDLYVSLFFQLAKCLTFDVTYALYGSPNDSFNTYQQLEFGFVFDDKALTGAIFGIQPSIRLIAELDGACDGQNEGVFLSLGINPNIDIYCFQNDEDAINFSLPISAGFSIDNYYEFGAPDDNDLCWGYMSIGAKLNVPLAFIPARFGKWSGYVSGTMLVLDSQLANYQGWAIDKEENLHFFVSTGLAWNF